MSTSPKFPSDPGFSKHSQNVKRVKADLAQVELLHKHAIREGDAPAERALADVHRLYVGIWAEASLRKIVVDPLGFNDLERDMLFRQPQQIERWKLALELALRRHKSIPIHLELGPNVVGEPLYTRYIELRDSLKGYLEPVITVRNKIGHGQPVWQLKSRSETDFITEPVYAAPSYWVLANQRMLLELIVEMIHLLVRSEAAFGRQYAELSSKLDGANLRRVNLDESVERGRLRTRARHSR